jgi:putative endonuclease
VPDKKKLGEQGELIARRYLKKKGYKIIESNYKRKWGELDIIAKKKNKLFFFEVKYGSKASCFLPESRVNRQKKRQLVKMAHLYLTEKEIPPDTPCQIDILGINLSPDGKSVEIRHYENAVEDTY